MSYLPTYTDSSAPNIPSNPPNMKKPPPENKPSKLLTKEENLLIFDILGKGRQTLATAVVQLLVPTHDQRHWQKKETGVVCFVRDQTKKSYYIQVLSLRERKMIFRQEIYNQFEYQMPQPFFLTFEGDNQMVGINFADTEEANTFRQVLDNKLEMKRRRRDERIRSRNLENQVQQNSVTIGSNALSQNNHISQHPPSANGGLHSLTGSSFNISSNKASKTKRRKDKDGKKNRLKKEDIGIPTDFRHVQHVGWDADKGFDLDISDPSVQTFFEKVGVSANQLEDKGTRSFIYDFIAKHGGVAALKNEVKNDISFTGPDPALPPGGYLRSNVNPPPPVPARVPSIPNAGTGKPSAPPPPPSRPVPPPPSSGSGPPPPPNRTYPSTARGPPAPKSSPSVSKPSTPTSMHNGVCPPPPPPPPPPNFSDCSIPPPPPLIPSSSNTSYGGESDSGSSDVNQGSSEPRSELWEEIKKGVSLRHVKTDAQPKRSCDPSREWLGDIKSGNISLRPVPEQVKQQPNLDEVDGLAGALARALAERQRAMNPSDSSNSDDDEAEEIDDEEWDE